MRIIDIKADGTVYWFERQNEWGNDLRADYSRGAIKRVGEKRYSRIGWTWSSSYREDPKGRFILAERVSIPGDDYQGGDRLYVSSNQVRDEFQAVKERYETNQAAKRSVAIERQRVIDALHERADALRFRLADLGLDKLIQIRVIEGSPYRSESPRMDVSFNDPQQANLASLLTHIEALTNR